MHEVKPENTIAEQIETAIEILGKENVFGPKEVEATFVVHVREVPEIPFSMEELERAKKLGQMLMLRVESTDDHTPMSLETMNNILVKNWTLVFKDLLPNSTNKNYIEQTEVIINTLCEKAFKDIEIPEEYKEVIQEFESNKERLTQLMMNKN